VSFEINGMSLPVTRQNLRQSAGWHKRLKQLPVSPSDGLLNHAGRARRITIRPHAGIKTFDDGRVGIYKGPVQIKDKYLFSCHGIKSPVKVPDLTGPGHISKPSL
jgi:hypothetical protein